MKLSKFNYTEDDWPITFSEPFFHYLNTNIQGEYTVVEHENIILPLIIKNKYRFKIGYFIHAPLENGEKLSSEKEQIFFTDLILFLKENKQVDFILPPLHIEVFSHIPSKSNGYEMGIIKLRLDNKTEEELFSSFKPVYRIHIRKAIKAKVEIKIGMEYFDEFYKLYKEKMSMEYSNYDSYDTIKKLINGLNSGDIKCGISIYNGQPDSGLLNISDKNNAYYFYGATSNNAHNGSFRLLQWEIIKQYKKSGIKNYQLGGARKGEMLNEKHARLLAFKMGFGAIIDYGFHFTLLVNPFKYKLYNWLIVLKAKFAK